MNNEIDKKTSEWWICWINNTELSDSSWGSYVQDIMSLVQTSISQWQLPSYGGYYSRAWGMVFTYLFC